MVHLHFTTTAGARVLNSALFTVVFFWRLIRALKPGPRGSLFLTSSVSFFGPRRFRVQARWQFFNSVSIRTVALQARARSGVGAAFGVGGTGQVADAPCCPPSPQFGAVAARPSPRARKE